MGGVVGSIGQIATVAAPIAGFFFPPAGIALAVAGFALGAFAATQTGKESSDRGGGQSFEAEARGNSFTVRSADEPHRTGFGTFRVGGNLNWVGSRGASNKFGQQIIDFGSGPWDALEAVYFNGTEIDFAADVNAAGRIINGKYARGRNTIQVALGAPDQAALPDAVANMDGWTADHRNRGVVHLYVELEYVEDLYPTGWPQISARFRGVNTVLDTRTSQTGYSNNPAMLIRHYLLDPVFGMGADAAEIDEASFIAAANICDEQVPLTAGGSQARYTCDGVLGYADRDHADVMEELLTSMAGLLTWSEFQYKLYPAAYRPPVLSIDETCLAGDVGSQSQRDWQNLYNIVAGRFIDPSRGYQLQDFPEKRSAAYIAQDGKEKRRVIKLPFTIDATRAQRIAQILLNKSRAGSMTWPGNMIPVDVAVGEPINVNFAFLNMTNEVMIPLRYVDDPRAGIELGLEQDDASYYAWSPGDARDIGADTQPEPDNPPPVVATLTATQSGPDKVTIKWAEVDPRPFAYTIKYAAPGVDPMNAILIDNFERGTQIITAEIPPGTWVIYIWTDDEFGVQSPTAASVQVTVTNFLDIIEGPQEAPIWPGINTGWTKHWTGVLRPASTKLASEMTDAELWDQFEAYPVATSIYEINERDRGFDAAGVRVYAEISSRLGPGETVGSPTPLFEIDHRLSAGLYQGFKPWTLGFIDYRYLKARITQDNTASLVVIEGLRVVEDIQEQTLSDKNVEVEIGGSTIAFAQRFHAVPSVTASVVGSTVPAVALVENVTTTSFDVEVLLTEGTDIGGTINWHAIGPLGRQVGNTG